MSSAADQRCTGPDLDRRGEISLPVLRDHEPRGTIRRSRNGRRRAAVLATVQLLIIAHVVLWLLSRRYGWLGGGRTLTPVEPSESMEFVKHGVVNAGLVFFALALLSTLVLGRWFCGWGCHLVMLQDLCGWIMRKMGVRPKPFRSRLLIYVPLILALYMFVWPVFYRFAVAPWVQPDLQWPGFSVHMTTTDFWRTFPGLLVAVPFLGICGFAAVYFLGAKGFCTYGCPYGGFFAPLDGLAVGRIRVTDACEQCGHCTAVCTSNVRVHEEVKAYGMVVDPGCMKCLDCVSVCPNDALYYGLGRPALSKQGPAPRRAYDLTWPEEIGFAALFLVVFLAVRGVYGLIPMLMAAGVAGVVTFLAFVLWRMLRRGDVRFHQFRLRAEGRLTRAGAVFAAVAVAALLLCAHSGLVNAAGAAGGWFDRRVAVPAEAVLGPAPTALSPDARRAAHRALACYRFASGIGEGGIGLTGTARLDTRMAWLLTCRGEYAAAQRHLERARRRGAGGQALARDYGRLLRLQSKDAAALAWYREVLGEHPEWTHVLADMVPWSVEAGYAAEAEALFRRLVERAPRQAGAHLALAVVLAAQGDDAGAAEAGRRAAELAPPGADVEALLPRGR